MIVRTKKFKAGEKSRALHKLQKITIAFLMTLKMRPDQTARSNCVYGKSCRQRVDGTNLHALSLSVVWIVEVAPQIMLVLCFHNTAHRPLDKVQIYAS